MTSKKTHKKIIFKEYLALIFHIILFIAMLLMTIQNIIDKVVWMTTVSGVTAAIWGFFALEDIKQIAKAKGSIDTIDAIEAEQKKQTEDK